MAPVFRNDRQVRNHCSVNVNVLSMLIFTMSKSGKDNPSCRCSYVVHHPSEVRLPASCTRPATSRIWARTASRRSSSLCKRTSRPYEQWFRSTAAIQARHNADELSGPQRIVYGRGGRMTLTITALVTVHLRPSSQAHSHLGTLAFALIASGSRVLPSLPFWHSICSFSRYSCNAAPPSLSTATSACINAWEENNDGDTQKLM